MTPTVQLGVVMAAIAFARTVALLGTVLVFLGVAGALRPAQVWAAAAVLVVGSTVKAVLTVRYAVRRDRAERAGLA